MNSSFQNYPFLWPTYRHWQFTLTYQNLGHCLPFSCYGHSSQSPLKKLKYFLLQLACFMGDLVTAVKVCLSGWERLDISNTKLDQCLIWIYFDILFAMDHYCHHYIDRSMHFNLFNSGNSRPHIINETCFFKLLQQNWWKNWRAQMFLHSFILRSVAQQYRCNLKLSYYWFEPLISCVFQHISAVVYQWVEVKQRLFILIY
jgi:hypothetical protein